MRRTILMPACTLLCSWIFLLLLSFGAQSATNTAADVTLTAGNVFSMLPPTIFENTVEGLSDTDKQELLTRGRTGFWEIAGETEDVMVLSSLPFHDSSVALRLFRHEGDGSVTAAMGTLGNAVCTMELWRVDVSGRTVPVDTPQEPAMQEFFAKGYKLPKDLDPAILICLGLGGLKAQPLLWGSAGMVELRPDYDISWQWNGKGFDKKVTPHVDKAPQALPTLLMP